MTAYRARVSRAAEGDMERLFDFALERALASDAGDPDVAVRAMAAMMASVRAGVETLRRLPWTCRKAGEGCNPLLRELVTGFGSTGYVALFEILATEVVVGAVRHQREEDHL